MNLSWDFFRESYLQWFLSLFQFANYKVVVFFLPIPCATTTYLLLVMQWALSASLSFSLSLFPFLTSFVAARRTNPPSTTNCCKRKYVQLVAAAAAAVVSLHILRSLSLCMRKPKETLESLANATLACLLAETACLKEMASTGPRIDYNRFSSLL
jgi:hypothetical protein